MRQSLVKCMYTVQYSAICGQVIKKKMHRVSAQMYLRATVQDGVSGLDKQLQIFYCLCINMAALLLTFQDGVSRVHKMATYKDEGSLGKIFLTV
jgi:hypothetical protein